MASNYRRRKNGRYRSHRRKISPAYLIVFILVVIICGIISSYKLFPDYFPFFYQDTNNPLNVEVIKSQELSIHFLELGNKYTGDCTLIKAGDVEVLIDAGSKTSSIPTIKKYLNQYITDNTIEYVVVTHAHEDHYAGFATPEDTESLFDFYEIDTIIQFAQVTTETTNNKIYSYYLRELSELNNTQVYTAQECMKGLNGARSEYQLSENVTLQILDQRYYYEVSSTENNHSVCCQIVQNNSKYFLFTGDLEKQGEESLVEMNNLCQVELYKAGHHGSSTSSHNTLLEVIKPKVVCVCCCAGSSQYTSNNENQFPTQEFIDRISLYTEKVYVTTLCINFKENKFESMNGNIVITSNRTDIKPTVQCSNNSTILKNTKWFKTNRNTPNYWL